MKFILNENTISFHITQKKSIVVIIALFISLLSNIILAKYKMVYSVTLNGEKIGYVKSKTEFSNKIDNEIFNTEEPNVAFIDLGEVEYELKLIPKSLIDEENTFKTIKESSKNIYRVYEVADSNSQNMAYTNTMEEAEILVNTLKQNYNEIEPDLKIVELYLEEPVSEETIKTAKENIEEELQSKLAEKKQIEKRTVNGIYLASLPLTGGTITSRYGSRESIRSHSHAGLDIASRYGSPIYAAADGTVKFAGSYGGYGNLVIVSHGNGVETYYGHCSSICAAVGAKVNAGDLIAKVGSTGNSTGNHLHFEIRINGTTVNPQKYIY